MTVDGYAESEDYHALFYIFISYKAFKKGSFQWRKGVGGGGGRGPIVNVKVCLLSRCVIVLLLGLW